jgi:hypothetical protein
MSVCCGVKALDFGDIRINGRDSRGVWWKGRKEGRQKETLWRPKLKFRHQSRGCTRKGGKRLCDSRASLVHNLRSKCCSYRF